MQLYPEFKISLPKNGILENITTTKSLLFVGANGSGKTRLGTWIEFNSSDTKLVHRISAQKSLSMPDGTTPVSIEKAENDLLFGRADLAPTQEMHYKLHSKFGNNPAVFMLNDFQKLMVYLFSESTEANSKYVAEAKTTTARIAPPVTKLDAVKQVWETILPHRELVLGGLRVQTRIRSSPEKIYNSSEMSDGERVIFYLVGQCLAAPKGGIIIIDEPELHLHKSVQAPLWSEVERLRPDCLFVYLTHDVDFAASQSRAQLVWLKGFDGKNWDWELIAPDANLPDELLIEVLGSRKPVLFVEGETGSKDIALYRTILPEFLIVPRGGCEQVIQSVKALKANHQLHRLQVYGLIDRDRRLPEEIVALEKNSIYVLDVAEVENLFCTQEILAIVSKRLEREAEVDFTTVRAAIFSRLASELDVQVSMHAISEIKFQLLRYDAGGKDSATITRNLQSLFGSINAGEIFAESMARFKTIIEAADYRALLRLYNRKSLTAQASAALGLKNEELPDLVIRLALGECVADIKAAVRNYFGNFVAVADMEAARGAVPMLRS